MEEDFIIVSNESDAIQCISNCKIQFMKKKNEIFPNTDKCIPFAKQTFCQPKGSV